MAVSPRRRFGFRRLPVVTGVVFAVTATTSILQFAIPGMLEALQRTPQGLHGDWWRTFTALLVQDGGVAATASKDIEGGEDTSLSFTAPAKGSYKFFCKYHPTAMTGTVT
jgi:Cupredoxin-like domain